MLTTESDVHIEWLESPMYKTYYIKYKLMKRLSCSLDAVNSTLQEASTTSTNFILHLEPNALYEIFLTGNQHQKTSLQNSTVITFGRLPDISPSFLKEKTTVSNESVHIFWMDPSSSCERLNGFFKNYLIELLDTDDTVLNKYDTGKEDLNINGLLPNTSYKLRIRKMEKREREERERERERRERERERERERPDVKEEGLLSATTPPTTLKFGPHYVDCVDRQRSIDAVNTEKSTSLVDRHVHTMSTVRIDLVDRHNVDAPLDIRH
ncbi:hypothetical protein WDU94_005953 [Cyamophila willieti]